MDLKNVMVERIDTESPSHGQLLFTFRRDIDEVADSVDRVGMVTPVVLREEEGCFRIVCGFRRTMAAKRLGLAEIPARVYSRDELPDVQALRLSLDDNAFSRGFNPIEAATALAKFRAAGYTEDEVVYRVAPTVGLTPTLQAVMRHLRLLRLPEAAQIALCEGDLELPQAFLLAELSDDDMIAVFDALFVRCKLNINEAKEVVMNLADVAHRTGQAFNSILRGPETAAVVSDPRLNKVQKGAALRRIIRSWRYPTLAERERRAAEVARRLNSVPGIQVAYAPYFEDDHVRVSIQASDNQQLRGKLKALEAALADGTFDKLFAVINL